MGVRSRSSDTRESEVGLRNTTAPSWRRCRTRDVSRLRHELSSEPSPTCLRNSSTKQPGLRTSPGIVQALIVDWTGVPKRDPGPLVRPWSSLKLFQRGYRPPVSPTKPDTDPLRHFLRPQRLAHLDRLNMTSSLSHKCVSSDSLRGYRLWVDPLDLSTFSTSSGTEGRNGKRDTVRRKNKSP